MGNGKDRSTDGPGRAACILSKGGGARVAETAGKGEAVTAGEYDVKELIEEARRELAMRRRFYPKWVRAGRIKQQDADRRIDLMEAIVRRLTRTAGV